MRLLFLLICVFNLVAPAAAEHVALTNVSDAHTHQSFSELAQYHNSPASPQRLNATQRAFKALLTALTPAIKNLTNYTGIFAGNCSVFFEDSIESAACDLNVTQTRPVELGIRTLAGKYLPQAYWHQISLSHILLATVFADWTHGTTQGYTTNLYFKQGTCSDSTTISTSTTGSLNETKTHSNWLSPTTATTLSVRQAQSKSMSLSEILSDAQTQAQTQSSSLSEDHAATSSDSVLTTASLTRSNSFTDTMSPTRSKCSLILPPNSTKWMAWNQNTGIYNDSTQTSTRFSLSNGIVTDSYTELQWKAAASQTGTYVWNATAATGSAQHYCRNETTGNFTDWRLPTVAELLTLVNYTVANPSLNSIFTGGNSNNFWSADVYEPSPSPRGWYVNFNYGSFGNTGMAYTCFVRCVRSFMMPGLSSCRYTDETGSPLTSASTQVKDDATGLIWQRFASGAFIWSAAKAHCRDLVVDNIGAGSWRLPSVKELFSLVNISAATGPAIDTTIFPNTSSSPYWSSTLYHPAPLFNAYRVDFNDGLIINAGMSVPYYARCVR